jgi:hypothetical protein
MANFVLNHDMTWACYLIMILYYIKKDLIIFYAIKLTILGSSSFNITNYHRFDSQMPPPKIIQGGLMIPEHNIYAFLISFIRQYFSYSMLLKFFSFFYIKNCNILVVSLYSWYFLYLRVLTCNKFFYSSFSFASNDFKT